MSRTNAQAWRDKWSGRHEPVNAFARTVVRKLGSGNGRKLLDLGCGRGVDSMYFAQRGFAVTAMDFSPSGIQELHNDLLSQNIQNVQPFLHDISQPLPFEATVFDVVYAHLSIHYFDDATTRSILAEILRVLRPGGLFFVKCKSIDDPLYGKGECIGPDMFRSDHTRHFFSSDYLRSALADFRILHLRRTSSSYHNKRSAFVQAVAQRP